MSSFPNFHFQAFLFTGASDLRCQSLGISEEMGRNLKKPLLLHCTSISNVPEFAYNQFLGV